MAKPKTFKKRVETDLSDEEVAQRKDKLVGVNQALFSKKAEKSEAMADYNADLKGIRQSMRDLVAAIQTGKDGEDIEVYERPCEDRDVVQLVQVSDDQVIEERPMTADERQGDLFKAAGASNDQDDAGDDQEDEDEDDAAEAEAGSDPGQERYPPGKKAPKGKRQPVAPTAH